ncbi:MAG: Peptide chain release factor 1 [candidate division BRC1 bacterium ADurb.BinA292]|nr:MAG: Peptide chain release factor 1 [candidate division BRC1 bacterium ADurb.BinA292]
MNRPDQRLETIRQQLAEIEALIAEPGAARDPRRYAELTRRHRELAEIRDAWAERDRLAGQLAQAEELAQEDDAEIAAMAREEIDATRAALADAEQTLRLLLLPRDPNDARNTIIEIRAGTGGEEAALFAGDLFRMYARYAEIRGWRIELLSSHESDLGGFKEVIFLVTGEDVFRRLKFEGGGHRVQRVPATEAQGRIHTSAVTVAVMPEAEDVEVELKPEELRIDVFRSSGPGGQSVNTTDSAVRVTHLPTGLVVSCQDEKSQIKNKAKALKVLRARLLDLEQSRRHAAQAAQRKAQVGSGDRSERIRTYNFPQNRLTDHRIGLTLYSLEQIIEGDLDPVIDPLIEHHQAELLRGAGM